MSKKHFVALADVIRMEHGPDAFTKRQIELIASFCKEQNAQFNRERWIGYYHWRTRKLPLGYMERAST